MRLNKEQQDHMLLTNSVSRESLMIWEKKITRKSFLIIDAEVTNKNQRSVWAFWSIIQCESDCITRKVME